MGSFRKYKSTIILVCQSANSYPQIASQFNADPPMCLIPFGNAAKKKAAEV
jgi:hypothetical protein